MRLIAELKPFIAAPILLGLLASACSRSKVDQYPGIPEQVAQGAVIIDTRTPEEFSSGHIDGAVNIPYDRILESIETHVPHKSDPVIVYCRSGKRSGMAKNTLDKSGYAQVLDAGSMKRLNELLTADP